MQYYSTKNPALRVNFQECLFRGLPEDNGLYMPVEIPKLSADFIRNLHDFSFQEIAYEVARPYLQAEIPDSIIREIVEAAVSFPAPVVPLEQNIHVLELFHGPSLAFKDFGARFMAQTMSWYNRNSDKEIVILVATSGDTGGAVAAGFLGVPGIRVVILYPSGKVSPLQEKQLTALGQNIQAIEVDGTFDDCQALVKQAFLDAELRSEVNISSANSINLARLIPQSFYYFEAAKGFLAEGNRVVFSIPSGNFGNLTAGLMAHKMGLPVAQFIAATNINDMVPRYLSTGIFEPKPSLRTLSNAMDVGNPSNFFRMLDLYGSTWNIIKDIIHGYAISDEATKAAILEVYNRTGYLLDPHGAVGYLALKSYFNEIEVSKTAGIFLETAHPAKFKEDMDMIIGESIAIPTALKNLEKKEKVATKMANDYSVFRPWLLENK